MQCKLIPLCYNMSKIFIPLIRSSPLSVIFFSCQVLIQLSYLSLSFFLFVKYVWFTCIYISISKVLIIVIGVFHCSIFWRHKVNITSNLIIAIFSLSFICLDARMLSILLNTVLTILIYYHCESEWLKYYWTRFWILQRIATDRTLWFDLCLHQC